MMTSSQDTASLDILAIGQIASIPTLLQVLRDTTGMGFAAVVRVTERDWTACAVQDGIGFGVGAGTHFDIDSTLSAESRRYRAPILIEAASADARYDQYAVMRLYRIESYVSVPIISSANEYFGDLFALDRRRIPVSDPKIVSMFTHFARLIASELDSERVRNLERAALLDERQLSESRDQFIAILGHDLRNPLQALFAGCDILGKRFYDPMTLELVSRMKTNAHRMSALIDDVLDFARGRLGGGLGVDIHAEHDMDDGLDAVVKELQVARPDCTILANISVKRTVRCDVRRIQQLASNLLSNALMHGDKHTPVRFVATADEDDLLIEVWNGGEPIAQENMAKIFSPFWRRSTSGPREGLGLGLHICSQIVSAHHGELTVSSSREGGTQFTARMPSGN